MNAALEIVAINPESGYGYEYLGDAYYFVEDYEQAAASYGLAVMYSEDIYYSSQTQVDALILSGDVEQANQVNAHTFELFDLVFYAIALQTAYKRSFIQPSKNYADYMKPTLGDQQTSRSSTESSTESRATTDEKYESRTETRYESEESSAFNDTAYEDTGEQVKRPIATPESEAR